MLRKLNLRTERGGGGGARVAAPPPVAALLRGSLDMPCTRVAGPPLYVPVRKIL